MKKRCDRHILWLLACLSVIVNLRLYRTFRRDEPSAVFPEKNSPSLVRETRWAQLEDQLADLKLQDTDETSTAHCIGNNFLPNTAWIYRSCQYRNLCFDENEWFLVDCSSQKVLRERWTTNLPTHSLWSSSLVNQTVSPIAATAASARKRSYMWAPSLRDWFQNKSFSIQDALVVPIYVRPKEETVFSLLSETFLPIYNLIALFDGWRHKRIYAALLNPQNCNHTCQDTLDQRLQDWLGIQLWRSGDPSCFRHGLAGMGSLGVKTPISRRGRNAKDYTAVAIRNAGRGGLFWDFRNHILQRKGPTMENDKVKRIVFAMGKGNTLQSIADELSKSIHSGDYMTKSEMIALSASTMAPEALLDHARTCTIWIANATDEVTTWPAWFLPRGSHLVLLYDETWRRKNKEGAPVMQDFDLWNQLSHVQVDWLASPQKNLMSMLMALIHETSGPSVSIVNKKDNDEPDGTFQSMPVSLKRSVGQSVRLGNGQPWFPERIADDDASMPTSYYSLDQDIVWMPYFAEQPNANNPGHLLWDYWLSMYTLLELYGVDLMKHSLTVINLDRTCVPNDPCQEVAEKFLPLLGVDRRSFSNVYNVQLNTTNSGSKWVCARQGLTGIGMLTDHGFKKHGQLLEDYQNTRNAGRGVSFWKFRNFMIGNMGLALLDSMANKRAFSVVFSINSSNNPTRKRDFAVQAEAIRRFLPDVSINTVDLAELTLSKQIEIVQTANLFITVTGGSASVATFLPRGSGLILFYNDIDDFVVDSKGQLPNRMDWDFWNHASYIRAHWMPIKTMDEMNALEVLIRLVREEIRISESAVI